MGFADYASYDGLGLAELVANRDVQPIELVNEAIARAEAVNPKLNAVVYADNERAREAAQQALPEGPFRGVPFFLKDILGFAKGMPTRQGAEFMPAIPSDHDSLFTARLRNAGLIFLGKTNTPEFGLVPTTESRLYGTCRNPWNLERSSGGSSGGSAALVAAGVVPLAHANDGGGSIRIPASCCGLVGLKPTRGRVSYAPEFGDAVDGLAIDLVVSRSVRDTAAALDVVAGNVQGDPYWAPPPDRYLEGIRSQPKKLRIAVASTKSNGNPLHPDCLAAVKRAARLCEEQGHAVEEGMPELDMPALMPAFMAIWTGNLAAGIDLIAQLTGQSATEDKFEGLTWGLYELGRQVSASQYLNAKGVLAQCGRAAARFHERYDVWLTPTLATPPAKLGTIPMEERDPMKSFAPLAEYVPFTALQNVTGQPAINLPLSWNAEGLPIGVQFVGRFGEELSLLQLAAQLEEAQPWGNRRPSVSG
jgi:amidase